MAVRVKVMVVITILFSQLQLLVPTMSVKSPPVANRRCIETLAHREPIQK